MTFVREVVRRRDFFPADASTDDAIASVEAELRERHDVIELNETKAAKNLNGGWTVTVEGVTETAEDGEGA